ncbi:MAG TPA: DAK2 domain-containing protein, partial [Candidatus Olsenella stercoravium]|nr:DAK2 domain-containing protein [Candidatus Olsenella stercoravium]
DQLEKNRELATRDMLDALVVEAYESVARTPELLPVLKENGVVDSGAFGFAVFMEAFVNAATGKAGELTDFKTTVDAKADVSAKVQIELNDDWEGSEFRYCNEFLFKAEKDFDVDASLAHLATLGDCELIVGAYPDFKVHVHSNEPNRVLEYMLQFGQVYEVFIHNMDMESHDRTAKIAADQMAEGEKSAEPRKALGFVAVAAGSGEEEILRSLGVDVVVSGGQTMNPSTADILEAIEAANADNVIVLPGNGNIRMAAEAAATACESSKVAVVPTKTVLQGFSAMFAVDPDASLEDNAEAMTEAIQGVRGGEVTTAVRDSQAADGTPIHDGDVMGIQDDSIDVVGSDVAQVTLELIAKMQDEEEGDSLTILAGQDMDDEAFEALVAAIEEAQPDLEVDPHRGEQPLYPVIFSIE